MEKLIGILILAIALVGLVFVYNAVVEFLRSRPAPPKTIQLPKEFLNRRPLFGE